VWRTIRARLLASAGRRVRTNNMRVNGPLKFAPTSTQLPFAVLFFGCLVVKFRILTDRYKDLNGTRVFHVQIGSRTRPYIRRLTASVKPILIQVRFSPLLTTTPPS
jgi:hypothetical protein